MTHSKWAASTLNLGTAPVAVSRVSNQGSIGADEQDWVAVEEPLQIRIDSEPVATIMRTPGQDRELAAGFLFSEGIIRSRHDLASMAHCGRPGEPESKNTLDVRLSPGMRFDAELYEARRQFATSSACGVCGRRSIDELLARCTPITERVSFSPDTLSSLMAKLGQNQTIFYRTGGVHAAAVGSPHGELGSVCEDVGRHNAVDKLVGKRLLADSLPAAGLALIVSSRAGFEIVHKAVLARIPVLMCVSAPTSLAVQTARSLGLTLLGFARERCFNIYAGSDRIAEK